MICLENCASVQCCQCLLDTMRAFKGVLLLGGLVFTIECRDFFSLFCCACFLKYVYIYKICIWMIKLQFQNSWMAVEAWQHSVVERGWSFHTWMVREPCDCSGKSARMKMWDVHWKSIRLSEVCISIAWWMYCEIK